MTVLSCFSGVNSLLERKCSSGVEKLKIAIIEHLQNRIPTSPISPILAKTVSFFTSKKALLSPTSYSKCSRDMLHLFPTPEDIVPLCFEQ